MRVLVVVVIAGCGFSPNVAPQGGQDGNATVDGSGAADDAKLFLDAMPDGPCPDDDSDGVCNAVDSWPCGAAPQPFGTTLSMTGNGGDTKFDLSAINIDGTGRLVVAAPSEVVTVRLHYAISDAACPSSCIDQLELGWAPGNRTSCLFDNAVPDPGGTAGDTPTATIRVPAAPGVYDIRVNIGQNYSCNYMGANTWWGSAPGANRTLAKVCVH